MVGSESRRRRWHAGCMPVTLGRLTLRADAVALVAVSIACTTLWE